MATFYNQPAAHRFGTALVDTLGLTRWHTFEVGVAWVRRSGLRHIKPALTAFLKRGGVFRISVGIDIENTSIEGLEDLLALQSEGEAEIYICHNEAQTIFHPKVYLFQNTRSAKLIVGSNNLTESGLFVNTEAGLEIELPIEDSVIDGARAALAAWRNPGLRLALPLDRALLNDLITQGYVLPERRLNQERGKHRESQGRGQGSKTEPLFGRVRVSAPPSERPPLPAAPASSPAPASEARSEIPAVGRVLLMRVRKASVTDRPTQTQVPMTVFRDPFFEGVAEIISSHDNRVHPVSKASARGGINTLKLEIPEMRDFLDPVLRLEKTDSGMYYQAYDAQSALGRSIYATLQRGLEMNPRATLISRPPASNATWWRFI